jgi:hypothetical protein
MKKILAILFISLFLTPALVSAQATTTPARTPAMTRAIEKAGQELERRITGLQKLITRAQEMRKITQELRSNLNTNLQLYINGLADLKTQIESAASETALKTQVQTVTQAYPIFSLMIQQATIVTMADRIVIIVDMMVGVGTKLQARIAEATQAGKDTVSLQAALTDLGVQLELAQNKAQTAVTGSISLSPDNGDKNVAASNTAALKTARTDLQAARAALVKARQDITTIIEGLRALNATGSTQVQVQ